MLASTICPLHLLYCNEAVTLHIQKFEDSHSDVRSELIQRTHDNCDELRLADLLVAISVKGSEQTLHVGLVEL